LDRKSGPNDLHFLGVDLHLVVVGLRFIVHYMLRDKVNSEGSISLCLALLLCCNVAELDSALDDDILRVALHQNRDFKHGSSDRVDNE
jgi:hypothetical protein